MSEAAGIETRSRSRSKTPGLLFGENGNSSHEKKSKKIPTISLIEEEEDVVEVVSSQQASQKPKRPRRSGKATASQPEPETSSSYESPPKNSQPSVAAGIKQSSAKSSTTTTTTTTVVTSKQVINGSEEKSEQSTSTTKVTTASNNDIVSEETENQNIFNNIFNAIKTSTPILSNKRSKRITQEVKSSDEFDYNAHPAYKEYKEAGEYWNKYPKTDYTYSELSPHRRELGKGMVAMPNMSRRSLDKYTNRVETMIQNNPTEESFLRRKFLNNMSYQKRSADLQYDSADEVDVSDLHVKLTTRRYTQTNIFQRFLLLIVSTFSAAYSNAKNGAQRLVYGRNQRYAYTPIKRQQQGVFGAIYSAIQRFVLLCISKVYLFISTVLSLDTWLLYTRSVNTVENRRRKRFLLGLLILLPLLLFGGTYIYIDPPQNISFPKLTFPAITLPKISFPSFSLPKFSWPSFEWPAFSLPSWVRMPSFSFNFPDFSFTLPEISLSWPAWLALPALAWPSWLILPDISFSWPSFDWPELSWPEWLRLPSFSFNFPDFSFNWSDLIPAWPEWLALPALAWPSWLTLPEISLSWPEWLRLPEFSLPKMSMPSISFEFLRPITTYTVDAFSSLKLSAIEFFDKIRDSTTGALNEAQIVWNENFNAQ